MSQSRRRSEGRIEVTAIELLEKALALIEQERRVTDPGNARLQKLTAAYDATRLALQYVRVAR